MRLKPTNEEAQTVTFVSGYIAIIGLAVSVYYPTPGLAVLAIGMIGIAVPLILVLVFGMHTPRIDGKQRNWDDEWFEERRQSQK